MPSRQSVWLITGCSSSLGHRLCLAVLARGDLVIALAASQQDLSRLRAAGACGIQMDSDMRFSQVKSKLRDAIAAYGRVDVVVNNPEYDLLSGHASSYGPVDAYHANTFSYTAIQVTRFLGQECTIRQIVMIALETQSEYASQATYSSDMRDCVEGAAQLFAAEYRSRRIRVLLAKPQALHSASGSLIPSNDMRAIAERIIEKVREGGFSELGLQVI